MTWVKKYKVHIHEINKFCISHRTTANISHRPQLTILHYILENLKK